MKNLPTVPLGKLCFLKQLIWAEMSLNDENWVSRDGWPLPTCFWLSRSAQWWACPRHAGRQLIGGCDHASPGRSINNGEILPFLVTLHARNTEGFSAWLYHSTIPNIAYITRSHTGCNYFPFPLRLKVIRHCGNSNAMIPRLILVS